MKSAVSRKTGHDWDYEIVQTDQRPSRTCRPNGTIGVSPQSIVRNGERQDYSLNWPAAMNAQNRLLLVSALLVFGVVNPTFADVLVLKDGTRVDEDIDSLLRGSSKAIQTPDGRSVGLSDAVATHLGVTAKELKAGIDLSSFISDGVRIDLVEAFTFETGEDGKREQLLQVNVKVTNRDERRYLNIETPRFFSNNYRWRLKDDVANEVRESHGDRVGELKLLSSLDRIEPEKTANGAILFELPLPKTEYLVLDLAPQMFEFNERLAFIGTAFLLIPFDSISTPKTRLLAATEAVERYESTADGDDQKAAEKLLDTLVSLNDKGLAKLYNRWRKLVPTSIPSPNVTSTPSRTHGETSFFDIKASGARFVYVVDYSSSMGFYNQLQIAKGEVASSLRSLDSLQQFHIIFYNSEFREIRLSDQLPAMWFATDIRKKRAQQYLGSIWSVGGTAHMPALKKALSYSPENIFLVTDAEKPVMSSTDLNEIKQINRGRTAIHTVEFGRGGNLDVDNFLKKLARENGGTYCYRDVTKFGR